MLILGASLFWSHLLNVLSIATAVLLILVVLAQRGKGGGLAGALGGAGGASAFGSKAGDKIMWFTIYLAAFWILLIMVHVRVVQSDSQALRETGTFGADLDK